jgi:hypothetical protein
MFDRVLRAFFVRRRPPANASEDVLRNYSLALAQEWGKEWLSPIQDRLRAACPSMSAEQRDRLNAIAKEAMDVAHDLVRSTRERGVGEAEWRRIYAARFPWVDDRNLKHLYASGRYYAWKEGVE